MADDSTHCGEAPYNDPGHANARASLRDVEEVLERDGMSQAGFQERPFSKGVFSFLFSFSALPRWLMLTVSGYCVLWFLLTTIDTYSSPGLVKVLAVLSFVGLLITGIAFLIVASVCWLAIAQDTANGYEKIFSWPDVNFMNWMTDAFFVIVSFILAVLPGSAVAQLLVFVGAPKWIIGLLGGLTFFFLFPFFLISAMNAGSPLSLVSLVILKSMRSQIQTWKTFYWVSAGLTGAILVVLLLIKMVGFLLQLLLFGIVMALMMVYFRLIGRLAWAISQATAEEMDEEPAQPDEEIATSEE